MFVHAPIECPTRLLPVVTFPTLLDGDCIIMQQLRTPRLKITRQQRTQTLRDGNVRVP
jgi:hypothetical protein